MVRFHFRYGLLLAVLLGQAGCDTQEPARAQEPSSEVASLVRLAPVEHGSYRLPVRASGVLAARHEMDLAFKIGGAVRSVLVDAGARVRKGQRLAILDPTEVQAGASQARQQLERAERDFARARALEDQHSIARVDVQNAETGLALARAVVQATGFNLRHTVVRAPSDGVIDRRMVHVGEIVAPGQPLFHLSTSERGAVARVGISDRDLFEVQLGTRAQVTLDAAPHTVWSGVVSRLSTMASPLTGTFEVEIDIADERAVSLPSGLIVHVELERELKPTAILPVGALVDADGDQAAVYVIRESRAYREPVTIRAITGQRVLLAAGAAEADRVVESGATQLVDGMLVQILP